jgi:type 1 glutamine amidotransferase
VGGAWYHDQPEHRQMLSDLLNPEFTVTMADKPDVFTSGNLAKYDVIAGYTSWWTPSEAECAALMNAVRGGKGFVCMHPSTASFQNCPDYFDMVGGEFVMHDPFKNFKVQIGGQTSRERLGGKPKVTHPITEGIADFEVEDELFNIQGDMTQWNILARAEGHPVVFTKSYGKGRVCNIALGHDDRALGNASVRTMYVRGIQWAAHQL